MIWHIFKKDLRLLWPMAAIVGLAQCLTAGLLAAQGQFERGVNGFSQYGWVSNGALPGICLLALVILTVAVIQQDPLPGTTQDWLTRPIPRGYLLAAKMLFIALVGLGPVLLSDVVSGIVEQLPLLNVITASLTRTLVLYGLVCLPALLVGIVTRSLTEALVFTLGTVVVLGVEVIVLAQTGLQTPLMDSGFAWTILLALLLLNVLALMVLLPLQLRWRATNRVRWIVAAYLCAVPAVIFLPWGIGFGLQQALAGHAKEPAFAVGIDAARKISYTPPKNRSVGDGPGFVSLALPVGVSPSIPDQVWQLDYARIRLIDPASGHSLSSSRAFMLGNQSLYPRAEPSENLVVALPVNLFHLARERHATVSATLFLTTFRLQSTKQVDLLDRGSVDEFSRCGRGYGHVIRCVSTRPVGTCTAIEDPKATDRQRRPSPACLGATYTPWPLALWRDPYYTFLVPEWVPEVQSLAAAVVSEVPMVITDEKGPKDDARVLRSYVANAHFLRSVEFALGDVTEAAGSEPKSRDGVGGEARFAAPVGMTTDSHGNVFIVDHTDSIIRKVTSSGEVTTFAGQAGKTGRNDGQGSEALFDHPRAIAVDAADNLYVADTGNALIRRISPAGVVSTVAGGARSAQPASGGLRLIHPTQVVCAHDGSLYVIDHNENNSAVVRQVLPSGVVKAIAGPDMQSFPRN